LPYKQEDGAEGDFILEVGKIYPYREESGATAYRIEVKVLENKLFDGSPGRWSGYDLIMSFAPQKDPGTTRIVFGKFVQVLRALWRIPDDTVVDFNALRARTFKLSNEEQLNAALGLSGPPVLHVRQQFTRQSKTGSPICDQIISRVR